MLRNIPRQPTAQDNTCIYGCLVYSQCKRPCFLMCFTNQGISRWRIKGFAATGSDSSNQNKVKQRGAETRKHSSQTPKENTNDDNLLFAEKVASKSRYRYH